MSKDCDIVKDLIIGYKENSLRENSISFVEEHIKCCGECKNYLKMVEEDIEEENNKIENDKNIDFFKSINKVINKNKKFVKVLSILLMIVIIFNIVVFINYKVFMNEVGMEIFLEEDVTSEEKEKITKFIKEFDIDSYEFKSKEEALNDMKDKLGENSNILENYNNENNIFPESYVVKGKREIIEKIGNGLDKYDGIKRIVSNTNYNPYEVLIIRFMEE